MKKPHHTVAPVNPASLRGLASHAESHWLTFATAMKCYASQPTQPALRKAAESHGPSWLRAALHGDKKRPIKRPRELEPTGSLAYLTAGAEEALKKPEARAAPEVCPAASLAPFEPKPELLTHSAKK